ETTRVMDAYFAALGTGQFNQFFTDDVTWTTIQNNEQVCGAQAVEAAINGLHARMSDLQTRQLVVSNGFAYLEGSCAGKDEARIPYCVAYEFAGDRIAAMRAFGEIATFMPTPE
ncbi:MAG TPA: nuclear transport factor 2 family protein, partial [Pedococcus sp.]|nr:nuclear transport factor 2 family protein [Pedococcus sp.]